MSKPLFYHTDTGSTKSSAVYQSVPTLSSPALQAPHTTSQPIDENLLPSRKKPLTLQVAGITVLLTLCTVVPILPWAWYVFIHKHTTIDWPNLLVLSTAGPTQFLLLPTVSMTVSKILVAPLMALYAYSVSADWIRSSATGARGRQPSPMHLASLLSLFQGASFFSLATVSLASTKRRQLAWPPILKRVVALLIWLLFLIYSLTAINFWLNVDAKAIPDAPELLDLSLPGYTSEMTKFSRQVDLPFCRNLDLKAHTYCGAVKKDLDIDPSQVTINLLGNGSVDTRLAWLENNIAILVTATPPSFGYSAQALGVRAVCQSVTDQCAKCNVTRPEPGAIISCEEMEVELPLGGTSRMPLLACPDSLGINITTLRESGRNGSHALVIGPPWQEKAEGNGVYYEFDGNPFRYGDVKQSEAYYNQSLSEAASRSSHSEELSYYVGNTGFLRTPGMAVNAMSCNLSVYDVEYQFDPPESYVSQSFKLTDATTASYVAYRIGSAWFLLHGKGFESLEGSGLSGGVTYSEMYGRQLSKIAIATTSDILLPSPALEVYSSRTLGTQVTLVGMLLLILVLVVLIITTVAIGVHATIVITRTDSKFLAAARGRLISVYPLIGDSFGGLKADCDCHKTAVSAALDEGAFLRETEADRLQLVQEPVEGGAADGVTVRLRPRRIGKEVEGQYQ